MRRVHGRLLFVLLVLSIITFAATPASCVVTDTDLAQQAQSRFDAGDLTAATDLYTQLLQSFPQSPKAPRAQLMLGRIKLKKTPQDTEGLLAAFSLVRTKYPSSAESADALVHIGFLHSKTNTSQSITDFKQLITEHPNHPDAAKVWQSLGRLYLRTRDLDKAAEAFDRVKTMANVPADIADEAALQSGFVRIMRYHATKDKSYLQPAIDALSHLSSSSQPKVRARADLGVAEAMFLQGKFAEAHARYKASAEARAGQAYFLGLSLYGAALSSQQSGELAQAIAEYDQLLNGLSGSTIADKNTAWRQAALSSTSSSAQASVQRDGTWQKLPGVDIACQSVYYKAVCLYSLKRYDDAVATLSDLIQCLPADSKLRSDARMLAECCQSAKGGN